MFCPTQTLFLVLLSFALFNLVLFLALRLDILIVVAIVFIFVPIFVLSIFVLSIFVLSIFVLSIFVLSIFVFVFVFVFILLRLLLVVVVVVVAVVVVVVVLLLLLLLLIIVLGIFVRIVVRIVVLIVVVLIVILAVVPVVPATLFLTVTSNFSYRSPGVVFNYIQLHLSCGALVARPMTCCSISALCLHLARHRSALRKSPDHHSRGIRRGTFFRVGLVAAIEELEPAGKFLGHRAHRRLLPMRGCYPGAAAVLCLALTTRLGVGVPADGILPNSAPPRRPPDANRIIPAVEPPLPPPPWHRTEGGLPEWDPQSISMATSAGVVAMARKARTAPTHEDVYELALRSIPAKRMMSTRATPGLVTRGAHSRCRLTPYDQALHVGPQRFSIHGHRMTIDRSAGPLVPAVHSTSAHCVLVAGSTSRGHGSPSWRRRRMSWRKRFCDPRPAPARGAPREARGAAGQMLRYRSRFKKWGTRMLPDFVFEELRRSNLTALQLGREPVHPTGYPTHRDSDEVAVLHGPPPPPPPLHPMPRLPLCTLCRARWPARQALSAGRGR